MAIRVQQFAAVAVFVLAASAMPAGVLSSAAAAPDDTLFRPVRGFDAGQGARVRVAPDDYAATAVDLPGVRKALGRAPTDSPVDGSGLVFRVPTPAGTTERFSMHGTDVMESQLAAAHPEIATFSGRSLDHPGTTIVADVTPLGFHAAIRGPQGQRAWYVDPAYDRPGTTTHLSYFGGSVDRTVEGFAERQAPLVRNAVAARARIGGSAPGDLVQQRVYRLALTSDPSYAAYFGSDNVLAEKVTLINRVNQIYNDDMAITMRLVNATDRLNLDTDAKASGPNGPCGAHPCFDPPDVGDSADPNDDVPGQLEFCDVPTLGRNRTVLGQIVGASNYDVGHLGLGVNGGGVAFLGVVGWDFKGGGCTGLPEPKGDFFAVDYVAHELGHQFAGNHTFNGTQRNCFGGNRNAGTSVEPGSGSSVMAYAGICGQDDLQPHSDPYFSQRSLDEVATYTENPTLPVVEVQTVSLRGFDRDGESVTLGYRNGRPVTLTRGGNYDPAGIERAVERLTGEDVTIAGWGYDPFNSFDAYPAPLTKPDDTGFQVIFAPTGAPDAPGDHTDKPSLQVRNSSSGVRGFVGETAKGGVADNGGSRVITTRNHAPTVNAPDAATLPVRTPFTLTGAGADADGDDLSYLWEQNDVGADDTETTAGGTALVDNAKTTGPLFRVFGRYADVTDEGTLQSPSPGENQADGSPSRTFPDMAQVLAGNTNALTGRCPSVAPPPAVVPPEARDCFSEFLPIPGYVGTAGSATPEMHFRLTARDGFPDGGGVGQDDLTLRIDPSTGPFLVTSFPSAVAVRGGRDYRITWKVSGTDKLARDVKITLSTDGGATWDRVLAKRTANDGATTVQIPRGRTEQARIRVEAVGNYFFAVNASKFTIN